MCGRFVQSQPPDWYARFFSVDSILTEALEPSYNVAPTDPVYAVVQHDSERRLATFRWGLLPFWAKDRSMAARNINARAETVADKAAFRESFAGRRCIIPADGFYEWQVVAKGKLPHYIYGRDGGALALAGLWASWRDPGTQERVRTCTIITGEPNELVAPLHDRMPVVLPQGAWDEWLDPGNDDTDGGAPRLDTRQQGGEQRSRADRPADDSGSRPALVVSRSVLGRRAVRVPPL
jgi:putative SOS response-associated peptidase YedK